MSVARWFGRHQWQNRASDYDSEELQQAMDARAERRELLRQQVYDSGQILLDGLLEMAQGRMPAGDVTEILDKHQKVIGTRPTVPPSVRREAIMSLLGLCGLVLPKRVEITGNEGDELRMQARNALREIDPDALRKMAAALGIGEPSG